MKALYTLIAVTLLVGCASTPDIVPTEKVVIKEVEYVVRIPPPELMTLPQEVPDLNVDSADQADVAEWFLMKEQYTRELENLLMSIAKFFINSQDELNNQAAEENSAARAEAEAANNNLMNEANRRPVILNAIPMP